MVGSRLGGEPPSVRQIVLLCALPAKLSHEVAHDWLMGELASVADMPAVRDACLATLGGSQQAPRSWPWMVRVDLDDATDFDTVLRRGPIADLIGDLRLIGMRPEILLVPVEVEWVRP